MMLAFAIDSWARLWLTALERACWQGGAALLVAWIICRLWRSMPGRAQCWVWRLAYAKLLLALVWSAPLNLHLLPAIQQQPLVATKQMAVNRQPISFAMPVAQPPARSIIAPSAERPIDWPIILLAAWALGVGTGLAVNIGRMISTIRLRRECEAIEDAQIVRACEQIAAKLGIKILPPVLRSRSASSPMLIGPLRPAIVLPVAALEQHRSRLELMLAHELAHHRRHDLLWNWPVALADVLLFFHPLVWLARRESRLAQELASDQLVLEVAQSQAAEYAQTLLSIALRKNNARPPACAVGAITSRKSLHRRIAAMSRFSNWSSARWTIAGAIMVALALLIIPQWRVVAADKAASPSATTKPGHAHSAGENPAGSSMHPSSLMPGMGIPSGHTIELPGQIKAASIVLFPPATGILEKVNVHEGQSVKQGDVLFEFDSRKAQAELRIAEATYQLAEAELRHAKDMLGENSPKVKADLETNHAKVEIAQANLDLAKLALGQMRVTAPFDGVIHTRFTAGQKVDAGTDIGELIKMDELGVSFKLPQSLVGQVKVGQEIGVRTSDSRPFKAQISSIAPIFDTVIRGVDARARLMEKTNRLLPGMYVSVSIESASPADEKPDARTR